MPNIDVPHKADTSVREPFASEGVAALNRDEVTNLGRSACGREYLVHHGFFKMGEIAAGLSSKPLRLGNIIPECPDASHDPPLLFERREGNLVLQQLFRLNSSPAVAHTG